MGSWLARVSWLPPKESPTHWAVHREKSAASILGAHLCPSFPPVGVQDASCLTLLSRDGQGLVLAPWGTRPQRFPSVSSAVLPGLRPMGAHPASLPLELLVPSFLLLEGSGSPAAGQLLLALLPPSIT